VGVAGLQIVGGIIEQVADVVIDRFSHEWRGRGMKAPGPQEGSQDQGQGASTTRQGAPMEPSLRTSAARSLHVIEAGGDIVPQLFRHLDVGAILADGALQQLPVGIFLPAPAQTSRWASTWRCSYSDESPSIRQSKAASAS